MEIKKIYELFDKIGCVTFSTVNNGRVESRIAHFFAWDEDGIYFRTMTVKPFYRQVKESGNITACGMYPNTEVMHNEQNLPSFHPGYFVRLSGDVRELTMEEVEEKAAGNRDFNVAVYDIKKYPETRIFQVYRAKGECYDYDYAKENRDHKLERERFSYGGMEVEPAGLTITDRCIGCGKCQKACSFDAIVPGKPYRIMGNRCDECGNCFSVCPVNAILSKGERNNV